MHALAPPAPDSRAAWIRLALCLAIATIVNVGMWSIIVLLPQIQAEFGLDRGAASLAYTATMLGFALGNVITGRMVDRFGLRASLIGSALLLTASYAGVALAPSMTLLALAQGAIGLGAAVGFGPLLADISRWFERRRGIAVAIAASGNYLSGAVWPLILAPVLQGQGWRAACWLIVGVLAVSVVPLALALRGPAPRATPMAPRATPVAGSLSPGLLTAALCLAGVGCCVAMSMPQVHIVGLCIDLGYGPAVGSQMLSAMLMAGVLGRLIFGLIGDAIGGVRTVLLGACLQTLALILFLPWSGMTPLFIVSILFGLGQGGIVPAYALIVREYLPAAQAGARVGLVMMATILGMALGGWMSGAIHDWTGSYQAAFLNGIGWNLMCIAVLLVVLVRAPARQVAA
jgi:MFS family permease